MLLYILGWECSAHIKPALYKSCFIAVMPIMLDLGFVTHGVELQVWLPMPSSPCLTSDLWSMDLNSSSRPEAVLHAIQMRALVALTALTHPSLSSSTLRCALV